MFPSKLLLWFKDGWNAEYISGCGPSLAIHVRGTKKTAGEYAERVVRILDERHVLWDKDGNQREWIQPFHEATKRIRPSVTDESRLTPRQLASRAERAERYRWFRTWLLWHGLPCPCNHGDITEHIAAKETADISKEDVRRAIERCAREASLLVGASRVRMPSYVLRSLGLSSSEEPSSQPSSVSRR